MQRQADRADAPDGDAPAARGSVEDIHLRNYDFERAYDIELAVSDGDGVVFTDRYYARPGWSRSLDGRLPPGEYEVAVALDGRTRERATVRIGDDPDGSALIECGNGCVTVTQGVY